MKRILLFISVAAVILPACAQSLPSRDEIIQKLVGQWDWVSSTGGIAGLTITPQTEGYTVQEIFFRDSVDSLWNTCLQNDSILLTRQIMLDTVESMYSLGKVWAIAIASQDTNPYYGWHIITLNDTVLHTGDNMWDGFESLFTKKRSSISIPGEKPQCISTLNRPVAQRMFFNVKGQSVTVLSTHSFSGKNLILQRDTYDKGSSRILKMPITIE